MQWRHRTARIFGSCWVMCCLLSPALNASIFLPVHMRAPGGPLPHHEAVDQDRTDEHKYLLNTKNANSKWRRFMIIHVKYY
jgi:hypothetical protein